MAALWISNSTVTDPESYAQYGKLAGPVIAAHGGRFIARSAPYTQLEGHEHPRHVVIRFPSLEEAVACYTSEGYHAAHAPAAGAAQRDVCIVECEDDPLDQPGALWIAHVTVTDEEAYSKYAALAGPAIAAHDGRFIARAGRYQQMEGKDRARNVVAIFPTRARAVECYHSDAYQAGLAHARGASERDLLVVEING